MKRQGLIPAQKDMIPSQMKGLSPQTAVHNGREHEVPANASVESQFEHDFSRVSVHPSMPGFGQDNSNIACPLLPQRCPFGGACHTCPPRVQAKLKIGQHGDKYEQEADRVADEVMRMPEKQIQLKECSSPDCREEDEDKILQAKSVGSVGNAQAASHPLIQNVLASPGQPLDTATSRFMQSRFGQDFSDVRVHTDGQAAESARIVNARAYTVGRNVVFGAGQYTPETDKGRRLVAHELVHVGQQENINMFHPSDSNMIQLQTFRNCTPATTGTAMTQDEIDNLLLGSRMMAEILAILAGSAVRKIRDGTATAAERTVFGNHFGTPTPGQTNTILNRFSVITRRLSSNDLFICNTAASAYCRRGWCSYNDCPSARGLTHICPPFFGAGCAPPENTMIHESAHAAGACDDNYPGAGYPPANAHNNAPSYEEYASANF